MTAAATSGPLLEVSDLVKHFPVRTGLFRRAGDGVHAVCGVSFAVGRGETLGVVGESGCGKSTTGLLSLGLLPPTSGSVHFDGREVFALAPKELRRLRRRMQIVFQDPFASLDPRMTVGASIAEPLRVHRLYRKRSEERRVGKECRL